MLLAGMLVSSLTLSAAAAEKISFDQGVDFKGLVQELKTSAVEAPEAPEVEAQSQKGRTERDCATISFGVDDEPISPRVNLVSRRYEDRCYPSGPNGHVNCHEEYAGSDSRHVRIKIEGRGEMLPWERDLFRVCLDGHWLDAYVIDASHSYSVADPDWREDTIVAVAGSKTVSRSDPAGVVTETFAFDQGTENFLFRLKDRWPSYYEADSLQVEFKLRRHRSGWFDSTLVTAEKTLVTSDAYEISFADFDGVTDKLEPGKKYYVEWRFKRVGSVSKDNWNGWWETEKVQHPEGDKALLVDLQGYAPFQTAAAADKTVCFLKDIEGDQCIYKCRDGSMQSRPVAEPDPWDRDRTTVACPQIMIPF